jgi:hypothetical protein
VIDVRITTSAVLLLYRRALSVAESLHRPYDETLARQGLAKLGN